MPDNKRQHEKKSQDATWRQTVVPGAEADNHSVAVRIRGRLPYLVIIFGSVDIIIALAGALGFGPYAIVSGLLLGVVELVIGYISYRAPFLLQRSVTGD
jgi:hypothetical protein